MAPSFQRQRFQCSILSRPNSLSTMVILIVCTLAATRGFGQSSTTPSRAEIGTAVMNDLSQGKFSSVADRFNPDLKQSLAPEQMRLVWNKLISLVGPFQQQISQTQRTIQGTPAYIVKSKFQKANVELRLVFDGSNQIAGIYLVPVSDASPDVLIASAKAAIDLLRQKRYSDVEAKFNSDMKAQIPPEKLAANWNQAVQQFGEFTSIKVAQKEPDGDVVDARCAFQKGDANIRIVFDAFLNIAGLWITPAQ
jgi:hypothetical protein